MRRLLHLAFCAACVAASGSAQSSDAHVGQAIACAEAEEEMLSGAYDAFLSALVTGQIKKDELRVPARFVERHGGHVFLSRSYYVTPNELRGFEFVIPESLTAEEAGVLVLTSDLIVESRGVKQRITILKLKKAETNKHVEATRGTPTENREARV